MSQPEVHGSILRRAANGGVQDQAKMRRMRYPISRNGRGVLHSLRTCFSFGAFGSESLKKPDQNPGRQRNFLAARNKAAERSMIARRLRRGNTGVRQCR